jgi:exodeoxyribonuclease VII small subunit
MVPKPQETMPKARASSRTVAPVQGDDSISQGDATTTVDTSGSSFAQAQQALETCLAELQRDDLALEELPGVYGRAMAWESRCREILSEVSQQIQRLDPETLEVMPWTETQP